MPALVDSCVLLDIFTQDEDWFDWSSQAVAHAANSGTLLLNPVIYAEISVGFLRIEELEDLLPADIFEYSALPREAAFLAGKRFVDYRRRGGQKPSPLPDFLIGAHAAVAGLDLITRDARRFRTYYPSVNLICP